MRLGDALISEGLINEEQLMQALPMQKKSGKGLVMSSEMHLVTEQILFKFCQNSYESPILIFRTI
jgi:hypothetical protein